MGLIDDIREKNDFTESERKICEFLLIHPEKISSMSSRELGDVTFSSASSITRFCKKLGCKGYSDFKLQFTSELKSFGTNIDFKEMIQISEKENIVSTIRKISNAYTKAIENTKKNISLEQMVRIGELLNHAEYIDFYAYDTNVHLAEYGCSLLFHSGKIATTYKATNTQVLSALSKKDHVAIFISHTGENSRLVEIAKLLRPSPTKSIAITSGKDKTLSRTCNEYLCAATTKKMDELWLVVFSTSVKYLLEIMFSMTFSHQYYKNMALNQIYEHNGKSLWGLLSDT